MLQYLGTVYGDPEEASTDRASHARLSWATLSLSIRLSRASAFEAEAVFSSTQFDSVPLELSTQKEGVAPFEKHRGIFLCERISSRQPWANSSKQLKDAEGEPLLCPEARSDYSRSPGVRITAWVLASSFRMSCYRLGLVRTSGTLGSHGY